MTKIKHSAKLFGAALVSGFITFGASLAQADTSTDPVKLGFLGAEQQSVLHGRGAGVAIDGDTNGHPSKTINTVGPGWWEGRIDTTQDIPGAGWYEAKTTTDLDIPIEKVVIYNRSNRKWKLRGSYILISSTDLLSAGQPMSDLDVLRNDPNVFVSHPVSAAADQVIEWKAPSGLEGSYVYVYNPNHELHISEVEVYQAMVPNGRLPFKAAEQKGTLHNGAAIMAVDGNTNGSYHGGFSIAMTDIHKPWWEGELALEHGEFASIDQIIIHVRTDGDDVRERLNNAYVLVSERNLVDENEHRSLEISDYASDPQVWISHPLLVEPDVDTMTLDLPADTKGKFIYLVQPTPHVPLNIAEVEVIGTNGSGLPDRYISSLQATACYNDQDINGNCMQSFMYDVDYNEAIVECGHPVVSDTGELASSDVLDAYSLCLQDLKLYDAQPETLDYISNLPLSVCDLDKGLYGNCVQTYINKLEYSVAFRECGEPDSLGVYTSCMWYALQDYGLCDGICKVPGIPLGGLPPRP